ncbi:DUF1549 domain-containing protein [Bryobacter aggregatus]|uniref:DUF1549 domain-containing protein n=1 Tax=Bryobacter aggregatus TaxID=360054 RepID=UPI000691FBCA|nr:DUF1549 domain-containing protein [Bryobacter aggregatus]
MKRFLCGVLVSAGLWAAPAQLKLYPEKITLHSKESRQQMLAEATVGALQEDWTRTAQWSSSNPAVAEVDAAGMLTPKSDGVATITAKSGDVVATTQVNVKNYGANFAWGFREHVIPVLSKRGCNQGACHGALAGKNGFKLTLRGYDPEVDYDTLTHQSQGRRVVLSDPEKSLLLQKASFAIPHGGGRLLKKDSLEYRVIREWIEAGAVAPSAKDAEVVGLEVYPKSAALKPGSEQQLVVRARYSDGRFEDVTRWAKYSSNDEGVAQVDDATGRVKMTGQGEAAITLWYSSKVLYARVAVPSANAVAPEKYERFSQNNYIDKLVLAKLKAINLEPSAPAPDDMFIRRAYLDAAGILPSAEEVENFLADKSPDKRAKLIETILAKDEFTDYWAYKWSDLMLVSSRKLGAVGTQSFYNWIRESVKENKPWDKFATELLTSSGSTRQNGALNYFVLHKDPIDLTENVTQAFLGQRLTCARCHNHPLEKWTQKQYYQMANLFARVGLKNGDSAGETVVFARTSGDVMHPRLLRPLNPTPLDGAEMSLDSTEDRRVHFAKWLTSPKNQFFARNLVNRVFGNFMGRGLTDPIDDVRATNPASNEELFDALVQDFTKDFDVKRLIRTIMNSGTYQLSSEPNASNQNDGKYYSHYLLKRLPAEVLLDSMSQVTGVATSFDGFPAGTRALQLPDVQVKSEFLTVFGRPKRVICDAGERSSDPSIAQALHVINGETLNRKLMAKDGSVSLFLKLGISDQRMIEQVYLSAFGRYPKDSEKQRAAELLRSSRLAKGTTEALLQSRRQSAEDLMWALLTSKEFLFNQ